MMQPIVADGIRGKHKQTLLLGYWENQCWKEIKVRDVAGIWEHTTWARSIERSLNIQISALLTQAGFFPEKQNFGETNRHLKNTN